MNDRVLASIDKALLWLNSLPHEFRNAATAGSLFIEIMRKTQVDLPWIERRSRYLNTRIYLIAMPERLLAENVTIMDDQPFWPWICVNSEEEADAKKAEIGLDDEDNLERLGQCGFLQMAQDVAEAQLVRMH